MNVCSEPQRSDVDKMLDNATSDVLLPIMRLNDKGEKVRLVHADWAEIRDHVKQQLAEMYFGTHKRLEELG